MWNFVNLAELVQIRDVIQIYIYIYMWNEVSDLWIWLLIDGTLLVLKSEANETEIFVSPGIGHWQYQLTQWWQWC